MAQVFSFRLDPGPGGASSDRRRRARAAWRRLAGPWPVVQRVEQQIAKALSAQLEADLCGGVHPWTASGRGDDGRSGGPERPA